MADKGYGDVSHFLQTPPPESDGGDEPVASHVVGAPQDVPGVQMGVVALATPHAGPAFGLPAPATDDGENHPALAVDVQPPQTHGGFPDDDPAPAVMANNDPMALLDAFFFDDIVLPNLETMSLLNDADDDLFIDDVGEDEVDALIRSIEDAGNVDISSGVAEDTAVPLVEKDYLDFVPFVRGELDCSNCRSVREMLHESANHKLHFDVHVAPDPESFQHAIFYRTYIDANGQTILNEMVYVDLRQRTHEWVQNFIANTVEMLKNDTTGQLKDSCSTSSDHNDPHRELEMDMLTKIFSSLTAPTEAVVPQLALEAPQSVMRAEENTNADDILLVATKRPGAGLSPAILESYQVAVQDGVSSVSATDNSLLAKQRKRISDVAMEDILKCIHMSKKDAAKELNISSTTLKRLCRKYNTHRWPARKFIAIDSKINKLQEAAKRHVGTKGLLAIKEKMDKLMLKKAQLKASVMKGIQENEKHMGAAGPSGSK
ncbi:unnamed protein product [Urochloa humidicola]